MKTSLLCSVALSFSLFSLVCLAPSCARAAGSKGNVQKVETYKVIKVTDENKNEDKGEKRVEYKAIAASQLKDEEKRAKDDYTRKMKEWHDLKLTDPTAPMPKRIRIQTIKSGYETQSVAQEYAQKLADAEANKDDTKPKDIRK